MKSLMLCLAVLISATAFAAPSKKLSSTTKMKACLAHLHSAQKAYYDSKRVYTENTKELGFSSDMCDGIDRIEVSLTNGGKRFMAAATKGRTLATIDDQRNIAIK